MNVRPVRAVIFDLDGTLLDSLADIANAANQVLQGLGEKTYSIADYRFLVGDGVGKLFLRALPACQSNSDLLQQCIDGFRVHYAETWDKSSIAYPGIDDLLDWLNASEIPIAVLSNKPDEFTCKCIDRFFSTVRFASVRGQIQGIPPKPDPAGVFAILQQIGVPSSQTIYVGDTNTDMKTAIASGCFAVGVTWGFRPQAELIDAGAQITFDHASELMAWIDSSV